MELKAGCATTLGCIFALMILNAILGAWLWPYTLNSWLEFFDKPAHIVWWQGSLIGFVPYVGNITIPAAFVTWVLMLFIA